MALVPTRVVEADGICNLRDVGGYPVAAGGATRWGVLYRGPALRSLTARGGGQLGALRLQTLVDLREPAEREYFPTTRLVSAVEIRSVAMYGDRIEPFALDDLRRLFTQLLEKAGPQAVRVAEHLGAS